jgi:hypothetical protein
MTDTVWKPPLQDAFRVGDAVLDFRFKLQGWWFTCGECSVSAHASCGPDAAGPDAELLSMRLFDQGFDIDLAQPAQPADALYKAMSLGYWARDAYRRGGVEGLRDWAEKNGIKDPDQTNTSTPGKGADEEQESSA